MDSNLNSTSTTNSGARSESKVDLRPIEQILEWYVAQGFFLVPVYRGGKRPFIEDYVNAASKDMGVIKSWLEAHPNCNWAIVPQRSGHIVVDVDDKHGGVEYWKALCAANGEPQTLKQKTGGGGLHYVFKAKKGMKYRGKVKRGVGIDTRFNNYIVVFPSLHKSGHQYQWENEIAPTDVPEWLASLIERREGEKAKDKPKLQAPKEYFKNIADQLKEVEFDYSTWVQLGMACHALDDSDWGLDLWKDITEGVNFKEGDLEQCEYKWTGFSNSLSDGITERSLVFLARELGCDIPNPLLEHDKKLFAESEELRIELELDSEEGWFKDEKTGKTCSVHEDFVVKWINEEGYAMLTNSSGGQIIKVSVDKYGVKSYVSLRDNNFKNLLRNRFFKFYEWGPQKGYVPKFRPAYSVWLDNEGLRQEYSDIVFEPKAKPGQLNLWSEIPTSPIKGDVEAFKHFILEVCCRGDQRKAKWLTQWLAHIVQKPWQKSTLVPVFIGDQGTGKGFLFEGVMAKILGPYFYKIMTAQTLKDKFNVEQAQKFLTFIDEATWRGDKVEDGILKSLTGSREMTVEEKFGARVRLSNYSRYAIASNNPQAVSVERSNRRYVPFEMNDEHRNNQSLFKPLWEGLDKGSLAHHIMDYFLGVDLSDFAPFTLPKFDTQGAEMRLSSEGVVAQFWWDLFFEDPKDLWIEGEFLPKEEAFTYFQHFQKSIGSWEKGISRKQFWDRTHKLIPGIFEEMCRPRFGDNQPRCVKVLPFSAAQMFCETLNLKLPDTFDDLDFFRDSETRN